MTFKTLLLFVAVLGLLSVKGQSDERQAVDSYKKIKKSHFPLIDEGMRARNKETLDSIAFDLETRQSGSFEYHLITYMNSPEKIKDAYHLQQAMALAPEDPDLIGEAIEHYGMIRDEASIQKMTTKLRKYGLYRKFDRYYKDLNLLMTRDDVLFTNGETDTRPLLMSRSESNADYEIIRISWLADPLYVASLRSRGIHCPTDYNSPSDFIRQVNEMNQNRNVMLSTTLNPDLLSKFNSELSPRGLAFTLENGPYDSPITDYEQIRSGLLVSESLLRSAISVNYLPLLRAARLSYLQNNNVEKTAEITDLIHRILVFNELEKLEEQLLK